MKIAIFGVKGMPCAGGIENFSEEFGSRLVERGHEVYVYVRKHYMKNNIKTYKGMNIIQTPGIHTKHLDAITHSFTATIDAIKRKVDIFFYSSIGLAGLSLLPRMINSKAIVQVQGLDWERKKWGFIAKNYLKLSDYFTAYFPNKTISVSLAMKEYYENKFNIKVSCIPNGVIQHKPKAPQEIKKMGLDKNGYILFLSRLVPEKGCHYLINAYKKINTDKKLVIAGGCNHPDEYYRSLKRHAGKNIIFTGFVQGQLWTELFSNAYCFVQPSETEGLSFSVLQALSFGKAVLASDIPGNSEALGGCGFKFKNKDEADLGGKLKYLLDNPQLVEAESERAIRHVVENYNWNNIVNKLEQLSFSLIDEQKKE